MSYYVIAKDDLSYDITKDKPAETIGVSEWSTFSLAKEYVAYCIKIDIEILKDGLFYIRNLRKADLNTVVDW